MAVDIINPGKPIRNGVAVVTPGHGSTHVYSHNTDGYVNDEATNPSGLLSVTNTYTRFVRGSWPHYQVDSSARDNNASLNADTVVYYGPDPFGKAHFIEKIGWSLSALPSGVVNIQVESPSGTAIFGPQAVTFHGPGFYDFGESALQCPRGQDALVRLTAGGPGVSGNLSVEGRWVA